VLIEVEPLYLVRWRSGYPRAERDVAAKWTEGSFYAPPAPESDAEHEGAESVLAKVGAALRANAAKRAVNEQDSAGNASEEGLTTDIGQWSSDDAAAYANVPMAATDEGSLVDQSNGTWTPTRLATLRQMWADGISADEIAFTLGAFVGIQ
jgi:hypothetical protein